MERDAYEPRLYTLNAPITIADPGLPDCPLVFANAAFSALTGYDRNAVLGRNCRFLQDVDTDPTSVAMLRDSYHAGLPIEICLLNRHKSGTHFHNLLLITDFGQAPHARRLLGYQHQIEPRNFRLDEAMLNVGAIADIVNLPETHPWRHAKDAFNLRTDSVQKLVEAYFRKQRKVCLEVA